jgi:undecaprenyl-diphosphatase
VSDDDRGRLALPAETTRLVGVAVATWCALQVAGIVVGRTLVGRHGDGPARHLDVPIHDWFIAHRWHFVGIAKAVAVVFDANMLGIIVVVGTAVVLAAAWPRGRATWSMFGAVVAYLGAEVTVYVVRMVIHRPRPVSADYPGAGALAGVHETSWSFPSGHATGPIAVLLALAGILVLRRGPRWAYAVAVVLGLAIATTRLVLGVHWFTDVATGTVLGVVWGATVCWVQRRVDSAVVVRRDAAGAVSPR